MQRAAPAQLDAADTEPAYTGDGLRRFVIVATTAFLTVVDLFAAQAILPALTSHYAVTPAQMAVAVNASTLGMAVASLLVALFGSAVARREGIMLSLGLLSIPTALLATAGSLAAFTALRILQGLLMASAFSLTLAYLGESLKAASSAHAFAAYITGNVASNLIGRFIAAAVTEHLGLAATFYCLAGLNIAGAILVYRTIESMPAIPREIGHASSALGRLKPHLANPSLRAAFAIGFLILFAFIGTFSFVNFHLMKPPLEISMMQIGLVYFVFLPSIFTTALAGRVVSCLGVQTALLGSLGLAAAGLPLLLTHSLPAVLAGMALVACGTFFAQATATGFTSRVATIDRGAASGLYLASYFLGGITGAAVLGVIFDAYGWTACVTGIALALLAAGLLAATLRELADDHHNPNSQ